MIINLDTPARLRRNENGAAPSPPGHQGREGLVFPFTHGFANWRALPGKNVVSTADAAESHLCFEDRADHRRGAPGLLNITQERFIEGGRGDLMLVVADVASGELLVGVCSAEATEGASQSAAVLPRDAHTSMATLASLGIEDRKTREQAVLEGVLSVIRRSPLHREALEAGGTPHGYWFVLLFACENGDVSVGTVFGPASDESPLQSFNTPFLLDLAVRNLILDDTGPASMTTLSNEIRSRGGAKVHLRWRPPAWTPERSSSYSGTV